MTIERNYPGAHSFKWLNNPLHGTRFQRIIACKYGGKILRREHAGKQPHRRPAITAIKRKRGWTQTAKTFTLNSNPISLSCKRNSEPLQTRERRRAILTGRKI